jgi:phosphonopyruvate decarboxylase
MIGCKLFHDYLTEGGVDFFVGVPDSLLKDFCGYIANHVKSDSHIVAANEGGAVALAVGHYLATRSFALVYMQNSGQGNATNPLVSLADPDVYGIPMLLLIGWRGEPGKNDEPQHFKQGKITLPLLDTLGIPYWILPNTQEQVRHCIGNVFAVLRQRSAPVALIVKRGTFEPYDFRMNEAGAFELTREEAIKLIIDKLDSTDIVVSTTGKTSRELYEYRDELGGDHSKDFLTVGAMGHASQISLAIALSKPSRNLYCLDGDGAAIMHMGSLAIIGSEKPSNFRHVIINNGSHDSVGGQSTVGFSISLTDIAKACGYTTVFNAKTADQVNDKIDAIKASKGPSLLEIWVKRGARTNLGRPKTSPKRNKDDFMDFLAK